MKPLRVHIPLVKYSFLGWPCLIPFSMAFVIALCVGTSWQAGLCAGLVTYSITMIRLSAGLQISADAEGIWQIYTTKRDEIKWSEVTRIEFATQRGISKRIDDATAIVLHSYDKKLALLGPLSWPSRECKPMLDFIKTQVESHDILLQHSQAAALQSSKNTRVSNPQSSNPPLST